MGATGTGSVAEPDPAKLVVLDDDPTGSQTVRDVPLLLRFEPADVRWALEQPSDVVFALTNTRALPEAAAVALTRAVAARVWDAAAELGISVRFVSRSDSTLRGHYPAEIEALAAGLADCGAPPFDATLLCPAFPEAGRVTVDDLQLLQRDGVRVPVGETEFARDPVFPYATSDLREWVAARHRARGATPPRVAHVTLAQAREGTDAVARQLDAVARDGAVVVLNAETPADLATLAAGARAAERDGRRFAYRTGPSFASALAGRSTPAPIVQPAAGVGHGLVVVGSHTDLTTAQLARASARRRLHSVELDAAEPEVARAVDEAAAALDEADVALVTSRALVTGADPQATVALKARIADAVVATVAGVLERVRPRFVVAKGGITAHDVAARAFDGGRATVLGQLFPGLVSVWRLEDSRRAPGMPYVVFPGNVGGEESLADCIARLEEAA
ncbi:MAG TPA: four-carbon acid sugar kinase family protein [Conexibacter sp.]